MNTGQTMLTVGAIVLLGLTVVSVNRGSIIHGTILQQTEIGIYAVSLAVSRIQEAQTTCFDQIAKPPTTDSSITCIDIGLLTSVTAPASLGKEAGEVYPYFNDIDDYNAFTDSINVVGADFFKLTSTVVYVDTTNPNTTVASRTWHKKISIAVTARSTKDTIRLSSIMSYFKFR